jgi:purine-nucleoside/S-methyl-5'-thioadenosine phosphorylase / adenosine deaminase
MSIDWITPHWRVPARVKALSTRRAGGVSRGRYASLNLGTHVGDEPADVQENRRRLRTALGVPAEPSWLNQVHGADVADLDGAAFRGAGVPAAKDAALTRTPGRVCAILTADCVPVLLADDGGTVVAAAHAGWRGLSAGVLAATLRALAVAPARLNAWIGPCIGAAHYEVGPEVREAMLAVDARAAEAFESGPGGKFHADLALLARQQLQSLGITRIDGAGECTYAYPDRYFSHRRDGQTGRQATLIWLEGA